MSKLPSKFMDILVDKLDALDWNVTQYEDRRCTACNEFIRGADDEFFFCPACGKKLPELIINTQGRLDLEECIIEALEECGAKL